MSRCRSGGLAVLGVCLFLLAGGVGRAFAGPVYFLVTELPGQEVHHDSYVLPLEDQADIAHARDLIARGPAEAGASIAVAQIAEGSDGINRDVLAPGEPLWNWHVTNFQGFADTTVEILDGWPGDVGKDVPAWIANTNGAIGFWSYTVTRELGGASVPVPLPAPLAGGAFLLIAASVKKFVRR
jgi:hypothetical protein